MNWQFVRGVSLPFWYMTIPDASLWPLIGIGSYGRCILKSGSIRFCISSLFSQFLSSFISCLSPLLCFAFCFSVWLLLSLSLLHFFPLPSPSFLCAVFIKRPWCFCHFIPWNKSKVLEKEKFAFIDMMTSLPLSSLAFSYSLYLTICQPFIHRNSTFRRMGRTVMSLLVGHNSRESTQQHGEGKKKYLKW